MNFQGAVINDRGAGNKKGKTFLENIFDYIISLKSNGQSSRLVDRDIGNGRGGMENCCDQHKNKVIQFNKACPNDVKRSEEVIAQIRKREDERSSVLQRVKVIDLGDAGSKTASENQGGVNEKDLIILKNAMTDKNDSVRANRVAEGLIRKAIGANNTEALQYFFINDEEIGKMLNQSNVDLLTLYYVSRQMIDLAQKISLKGETASVAVIDKMAMRWFKETWYKECLNVMKRASMECKNEIVKLFILAAKDDKVDYAFVMKAAEIRGIKTNDCYLITDEIDSFVHSLARGLRFEEAKEAVNLGASLAARNSLAAIFIGRDDLDNALALSSLGIEKTTNDILCSKFWSKGRFDEAIKTASNGITDEAMVTLRADCSKEGKIAQLTAAIRLTGKDISDNELDSLANSVIEKRIKI